MSLVDQSLPDLVAYEAEGRRIGASLDSVAAVVVVGKSPDNAAAVALGIGEAQATSRRVVVADLVGDITALTRLVSSDDPHGLSDSFLFGVSLNKVAQPVGSANLYVLPSGTEPVADDAIYRNDRWRRLVAGFREVGALLVLVASEQVPGLSALITYTDGAIAVGRGEVPGLVLDVAKIPRPPGSTLTPSGRYTVIVPKRRSRRPLFIGAGALAAAAAIVATVVYRAAASASAPVAVDTTKTDTVAAVRRSLDSASAAVAPDTPPIRNPGDSARATAFGVEIAKFSTPTGALMRVRGELPRATPAATFGVVAIGADATLWYRVVAGAAASRRAADSTLSSLRATRAIDDPAAGAVVSVPFAFRLQAGVAPAAADSVAADFRARGIPAYALLQDDSTATIYAGAFETADQAALFTTYLRGLGVEPALTYRLGRVF
jgi:hypothetical protein